MSGVPFFFRGPCEDAPVAAELAAERCLFTAKRMSGVPFFFSGPCDKAPVVAELPTERTPLKGLPLAEVQTELVEKGLFITQLLT